jgi:tetratricopeptide (TPR) repeat protein
LDYNESLCGEPESALAYYWRAQAFQALGDNDCALKDYDLAIQCEPTAENYYGKANFELMLRESLSALYDIEQALKIKPKCLYMQELRSRALLALGRFEEAKQNNFAIVKETPHDTYDWLSRATAKAWLGDKNGAIRDLNAALLLDPLNDWILLRRSCLHFSQKNYGKAASDFLSVFSVDEFRSPRSLFK